MGSDKTNDNRYDEEAAHAVISRLIVLSGSLPFTMCMIAWTESARERKAQCRSPVNGTYSERDAPVCKRANGADRLGPFVRAEERLLQNANNLRPQTKPL
jgi:hypothetical protein